MKNLLEILKKIVGEDDFIKMTCNNDSTLIQNLPSFEHCEQILSSLKNCNNFRNEKNYFKVVISLKLNENLEPEHIQELIEKYEIVLF